MSTFTPAQNEAIAARGNVLVSAGAGTGKTRTVVERCLQLVLRENCSLENILMVTFTEAAAAEMRARLRKELERARATAASERLDEQLALLDTASIGTLHSFCLDLIRQEFHQLGIDPQVNVMDEAQTVPLMHETLEALLERCYAGQWPHSAAIQTFVRRFAGSDQPLRQLVLRLHRYTQTRPNPAAWFDEQLAHLLEPEPHLWRQALVQGFMEWRAEWLPELRASVECANVRACFEALEKHSDTIPPTFAHVAEALDCIVAAHEAEWERGAKGRFRDPLKKFFEEAAFLASITTQREGRDPLAEDWEWTRHPMRAVLELARAFTHEFTAAKRALGGIDFADIEQLALRLLLDASGAPTETARAWQQRFTHVFVDECQDINAAQDAILRALSRKPGNRFLVGDVKQSIYRFRLADPTIFRAYENAWRAGNEGRRIALSDNFRSREGVLAFVNALFREVMREGVGGVSYDSGAELRFGASEARSALRIDASAPRVELHVIHRNGDSAAPLEFEDESADEASNGSGAPEDLLALEKEARLLARRLRELRESHHLVWDEEQHAMRPVDWRDIVVLLRSPGSRVETFAKEFARAGVPLAAERAGFYSAIEVSDLLNLLRLLDNPLQDIPLATVLRSPIVGLSLDELAAVRIGGNGESRTPFFAAVNRVLIKGNTLAPAPYAKSAQEKLTRYSKQFARWRRLIRQTSVSQTLETILAETHYEALLLSQDRGRARVANVRRLLQLARHYDPFQRQGLFRFLRFVDEQQEADTEQACAPTETANAVRLMSIHRSKGLEFPIVAVACLGASFNLADLREDILLHRDLGLCAKVWPENSEQRYPSITWWLARRREKRDLLGEELRLLYVALTRARDTLVLTAYDKSKDGAARWAERNAISERDLAGATSYWSWLKLWLEANVRGEHWMDETHGANALLAWRKEPDDSNVFRNESLAARLPSSSDSPVNRIDIETLRARFSWRYGHRDATHEPAKSNVSALRRRAFEEDTEAQRLFRPSRPKRSAGLSAAEIGTAHHTFQQLVRRERTSSIIELRGEAERLANDGVLRPEELASLNFEALVAFWNSPLGRRVREARRVEREMPFTARFLLCELQAMGLAHGDFAPGEFAAVQGVVDLAIIEPDQIVLVDFKTDDVTAKAVAERAEEYRVQLRLYGEALARIFGVAVTERWLHFLACRQTVAV
jgi:ATP-dependent helicase/nuclease subunit A